MKNIKYQPAGQFESTRFEKIHNVEFNNHIEASAIVAAEIAVLIRDKEKAGEPCVLGLATGSSPIKVYDELVRLHKEEDLSFKHVVTFNLDEYYPMEKQNLQSYYSFMHEHLFDHIDIPPENIHIPNGEIDFDQIHQFCIDYEEKIGKLGGLDFQLLGIGRTGHIGFNEPGSHFNSGTRLITLDHITRVDAADSFLGIDNVPRKAITMGIASVRNAKRIVLLAWGQHKGDIIKETIEGEITAEVPATYLQRHENTTFVLDYEAGSQLTRNKTPWLVGPCEWTRALKSKAIVWLCGQTGKSILRLTDKDYNNHGMSGLLALEGSAYNFNIEMFNRLQHTITGWPGGKPNADDSKRPERAQPESKRVIVFSPHPDDDVISMGGTLDRLIEQGHEVHVVYQTSGNISVSNEEALKFTEIASALDPQSDLKENIMKELLSGKEHQVDSPELRNLKGLIRRSESFAAIRYLGLSKENAHFLDLPFYETGKPKKNELSEKDISLMVDIISQIKPHQVYAAGDLADPHGTHKVCLEALFESLRRLKTESYMKDCWVWLYRGAWHEWQLHEIDMAVPISPDQIIKKRHAIFYHQSQKDRVMYQGDDDREFWMRAEERNKNTASNYRAVGLADYAAMEAFVRYHF
jgi:glucosamine-6-phosphate deaminase